MRVMRGHYITSKTLPSFPMAASSGKQTRGLGHRGERSELALGKGFTELETSTLLLNSPTPP